MLNYVLGPSHICNEFTCQIENELNNKELFNNCILDPYVGIPIWSNHIYHCIRNNINNNVFWIVSDYKFNNFDYYNILDIQSRNQLFLDTIGTPNNIYRDFLENYHIELLGKHSLNVIDDTIKERYKNNILDIDLFTTPEDFNTKILDDGGHPNKQGFILLDTMITKYSEYI